MTFTITFELQLDSSILPCLDAGRLTIKSLQHDYGDDICFPFFSLISFECIVFKKKKKKKKKKKNQL